MIDFVRDVYHTYRHVRMVRQWKAHKDTRWSEGVYLKRGGPLHDVVSVEGTTWTLYSGEKVDTQDIATLACHRIEAGYA